MFFQQGIDDNDMIINETEYISTSEVKKFVLKDWLYNDISIIHLNICSLPSNIDKLINLIAELDIKPDIIAISETKITSSTNQDYKPNIENYSFYNIPSISSCDVIGVFVHNSLKYSIRNDLCLAEKRPSLAIGDTAIASLSNVFEAQKFEG